jgi:hypothetical protein
VQRKVTYRSVILALAVAVVLPVAVNLASETVPHEWAPLAWPVAIAIAVVVVVVETAGAARRPSSEPRRQACKPVQDEPLDEIADTQFSISWTGSEDPRSYVRYSNGEIVLMVTLMATMAIFCIWFVLRFHWGDSGVELNGDTWFSDFGVFVAVFYGCTGPIMVLIAIKNAVVMRRQISNRDPWGIQVDAEGITTRDTVTGRQLYKWSELKSVKLSWASASSLYQFDHEMLVITGLPLATYPRTYLYRMRPVGWHDDETFYGSKFGDDIATLVAVGPLTSVQRARFVATLQRHGQDKWHSGHDKINIW